MAAIVQPQIKPKWPAGHKYGGPCKCKCKLRYIQPERPASFKPLSTFKKPECKIADGTTYKTSYYDFDPNLIRSCKGQPIIAKVNLISAGDFSSDTTHKMSYGAWPDYKPPHLITPIDHKLLGEGPLSQLTTHKHDYTPKPIMEVQKIIHPGNLGFSADPMEDKTTQGMSYPLPDLNRFEPARSYKPQQSFNPSRTKMEDQTTQKFSYQPFCPPEKEKFPWAQKDKYRHPTVPFEGNTIYNDSFYSPGKFVEDCVGPDGCYCMYPGECFDRADDLPKAHEFNCCPADYNPRSATQTTPITEDVRGR